MYREKRRTQSLPFSHPPLLERPPLGPFRARVFAHNKRKSAEGPFSPSLTGNGRGRSGEKVPTTESFDEKKVATH